MYRFELWFCLDICLGVGLLDHTIIQFFVFSLSPLLRNLIVSDCHILSSPLPHTPAVARMIICE